MSAFTSKLKGRSLTVSPSSSSCRSSPEGLKARPKPWGEVEVKVVEEMEVEDMEEVDLECGGWCSLESGSLMR